MFWIALILMASPAQAETLVANRTIRAHSVLGPGDLAIVAGESHGALNSLQEAIGKEARVTLYAGRPIRATDLAAPALVERNQTVRLVFRDHGLLIMTDGRALGRGAAGERIRVLNLGSKSTVTGMVMLDGSVIVGDTE
jgi:flagella basal body P-ring formation protein FlgA